MLKSPNHGWNHSPSLDGTAVVQKKEMILLVALGWEAPTQLAKVRMGVSDRGGHFVAFRIWE